MNTYEALLDEAARNGLTVSEVPFVFFDGLVKDEKIGIRKSIPTTARKADILCEELCHAELTVGNILDQSVTENRKQEHKARMLAYEIRIGLEGIVDAYIHGCRTKFDMAEYLDVSEAFLEEALEGFRNKYGCSATVNDYIVYFEPTVKVLEINT